MKVTTIRSSARKPEIPMQTDPVNKLEGVGRETVLKLQDIQAAARVSPNSKDAVILQDFTDTTCHVLNGASLFAAC